MSKLHELLAVETDLESTYKKVLEEAIVTFTKKADHFMGTHKVLTMFDESKQNENLTEHKEMVTTVDSKLDYVKDFIIQYFDAILQKEKTNQIATADLVVDGVVLAKALPATFLLGMETKLKSVRTMYEHTPTLPPGQKWEEDKEAGKGIYKTTLDDKLKTAKTFQHKVLVAPTDKHPAQVEKWEESIPVGRYVTTAQYGMLTPARKSHLIGQIDKLIQACKKARQRANCAEVEKVEIGKSIIDYINS
jgi:hypothetical protein